MKDSVKSAGCNSFLQLKNLVVCMLVVQYQTQIFSQKVAKEPEAMSSSICLQQRKL